MLEDAYFLKFFVMKVVIHNATDYLRKIEDLVRSLNLVEVPSKQLVIDKDGVTTVLLPLFMANQFKVIRIAVFIRKMEISTKIYFRQNRTQCTIPGQVK